MRLEKHNDAMKEVMDEIDAALKDPKGVLSHQRRLALMLSVGAATLLEIYFHKLNVMKAGSVLKHQWLGRDDAKSLLSNQITSPISSINSIDAMLQIIKSIESGRNKFAYGSSASREDELIENVNEVLRLRKLIEEIVGDVFVV
jgi:hypothetical protein